jgi:hypothetical protein
VRCAHLPFQACQHAKQGAARLPTADSSFTAPLFMPHCYKTFRRIPPPSPDGAGLILLGRGKRLLYKGREFAPSGTEVFRNHRKFPAIFTMKKGRLRMVGSNSVPLDYQSCPLPLVIFYDLLLLPLHVILPKVTSNSVIAQFFEQVPYHLISLYK